MNSNSNTLYDADAYDDVVAHRGSKRKLSFLSKSSTNQQKKAPRARSQTMGAENQSPSNALKKKDERFIKYIPLSCCHTCNHFHLSFCNCNCRTKPIRFL